MNQGEAREYLQFLLDGLKAFHPKIFEIEAEELEVWEGWSKKDFVPLVLNITQSKTVSEAKVTLEIWLSTPEATRNVPLVIIEAAREAKEVTKAPSFETQKTASEVLLAKSSNLKAEIEASGQPVLKPPSPQVPTAEAVAPTKPPLEVVGPAPRLTPVEEGAVVLRPLKAVPSLSANLESLANQASESHDDLREQVRIWIKETVPDLTDDETYSTAERFTQRLEGARMARPTQIATLKALAENPQVLSQEERLLAADLAKKAAEIAGRDKQVIEKALAKRISQQEIRQIFEQDNLKYKPESGLAKDTFVVKKEPFFKKAQASAIEGQKVDLKDTVAPAPPSGPPAATKPTIAVVPRAAPSPVEEGAVVLRPIRFAPLPQAEVKSVTKEATQKTDLVRERVRVWIKQTFPQTPGDKVRATAERFTQRLIALEEEKPTDVAALKALVKSEGVASDVRKKAGMLLEKATALAQEDRKIIEAAASGKISKEAIEQAFAQDEVVYRVVPEIQEKDVLIKAKPFIAKVESAVVKGQVVEITKEILPATAVLPTQEPPETFYIKPIMRVASVKLSKVAEKNLQSLDGSARQNAQKFISELKQQVAQNIPSEVKSVLTAGEVEEVSQAAAEEFTQRLLNPDEPTFLDLTSPDNEAAIRRLFVQKEIKEKFQALANQAAVAERANQELLGRAIDKELVDALYEPNKVEVLKQVTAEAHQVATADIVSSLETKVATVQRSLPAYHLILSEDSGVPSQTRAASRLLGIAIVKASPKAQTLAQSATTKSLKFAIDLGAEQFAKTSPDEATALKLLSLGIGSEQTKSLVVQAQKLGLEKEVVERLQNLERIIKAFEETRPEFLQMVSTQGVEIKLLTEYSEILTSQITLQPTEASYVFSPQSFQGGGIQGLAQRFFGRISSSFLDRIVGPAKQKIFSLLGGKAKGKLAKLARGKTLKAGVKGLAIKAVAKLGLKGLFTKIGAAIGTALGAVFGPLAPIIGAIVGFLSSFALNALSWLKRKIAENKEVVLGLLLLGSGLFVGGALGLGLIAAGGLTALGATAIKLAGLGGAGASVGGVFSSALTGLTSVALPAIGVPIVVSLLTIPFVVAIILFIINSGAYIVPPQAGVSPFTIESAYIGVTKTAEPAGPFQNGDLPINITYTIEVTAKKGTLTNISFDYVCEVIKDGPAPSCPPITPDIPSPPPFISPVEPFTFSYTYRTPISGSSFFDSFVVDTFTVTADAPEKAGDKAASSVSIKIGTPPDECPDGWPIFPSAGEGSLPILQGPYGPGSHRTIEAIDIAASIGHPVRATHSGIGAEGSLGGAYGRHVIINSSCGGKPFISIYAHLSTIDSKIVSGAAVTKGQTIGLSGITGTDNAHLHYHFSPGATIPMAPPYIPKSVPRGCWNWGGNPCGVSVP